MLSPVSDAVMSVVAQSAVVRSSPGYGGPRPTTNFTLQSDTVTALTRYIANRDQELWWS